MTSNSIDNAASSFEKYMRETIQPAFESVYGDEVCFYFEPYQFRTYPSAQVHEVTEGMWDSSRREYYSMIEFHINTRFNETSLNRQMQDAFYNTTGLKPNNVHMWKPIDLLDFSEDIDNPTKYSCMRLFLDNGRGFRYVPTLSDTTVRIYRADLLLYYK